MRAYAWSASWCAAQVLSLVVLGSEISGGRWPFHLLQNTWRNFRRALFRTDLFPRQVVRRSSSGQSAAKKIICMRAAADFHCCDVQGCLSPCPQGDPRPVLGACAPPPETLTRCGLLTLYMFCSTCPAPVAAAKAWGCAQAGLHPGLGGSRTQLLVFRFQLLDAQAGLRRLRTSSVSHPGQHMDRR